MAAVTSAMALATPARAAAGQQRVGSVVAARPSAARTGVPIRGRSGFQAVLSGFASLSIETPARKQAQRGMRIAAMAEETVMPSINQVGFMTPPSVGEAPTWDAIVEVGGSQQFVAEGRYYSCHSLKGVEPGMKIAFERVLATLNNDEPTFGMPYVKGARVEATVLENFRDTKKIVFKYKKKKHYRRKNGHRQSMTRFLVTKVVKP